MNPKASALKRLIKPSVGNFELFVVLLGLPPAVVRTIYGRTKVVVFLKLKITTEGPAFSIVTRHLLAPTVVLILLIKPPWDYRNPATR